MISSKVIISSSIGLICIISLLFSGVGFVTVLNRDSVSSLSKFFRLILIFLVGGGRGSSGIGVCGVDVLESLVFIDSIIIINPRQKKDL